MGLPNIGPLELIIILAIALLIVGPGRLPEMGNAVGRTIREFRKASSDVADVTKLEASAESAPEAAPSGSAATADAAPAAATVSASTPPESGTTPDASDATAEEKKADTAEQA